MTVGSLFAGIGGFDLGFERAGFDIKWQVEIDGYATRVLAKHWPDVQRYGDIRAIDWAAVEPVDVVCGGFPCQPHSLAGRRKGSEDERDLWPEFIRCIRGVRPRWVVAENVPGLLSTDFGWFYGTILRDLAACGYDAEWDGLPASAFGAHHRRDRVWIIAYPNAAGIRVESQWLSAEGGQVVASDDRLGAHVADTNVSYEYRRRGDVQMGRIWGTGETANTLQAWRTQWSVEPNVGRVAHGIPDRVDRLKGLGNAIVPQIAEWIARRIVEAEQHG